MLANKKFRIILIVLTSVLVLGIIIILILYSILSKPNQKTVNNINKQIVNQNTNQTAVSDNTAIIYNNQDEPMVEISQEQIKADIKDQEQIMKIASNFTERFGTYSNQNDFANLVNLKSYMTKEMQEWSDNIIIKNKARTIPFYESVTTQATSVNLTAYDKDQQKATAIVETIRREEKELPASQRDYKQSLELQFKKQDNTWKVDKVKWRK